MTQLALTARGESRLAPAGIVVSLLAVVGLSWLIVAERMAGMDNGPGGDPGALGWFAATWALMTGAMMLPAAARAVLYLARDRRAKASIGAVLFLAGYFAVWMLAGLAGYWLVEAARGLRAGALAWSAAGGYIAGAAVAAAGLYQLTGVKRRWLARCRTPQFDLLPHRAGGALPAGVRHGGCCVACCWTLMVALYALGMMSVTWMAVLTIVIVGERVLPRPAVAMRAAAAVLLTLGVAVAFSPASVPALTIPTRTRAAMMWMHVHMEGRGRGPGAKAMGAGSSMR